MNTPDVTEQSQDANAGCVQRVVSCLTGKISKSAKRAAAKRVKEAFDGVDWGNHTFITGSVTMTSKSGETKFYECGQIDAAIKRLNDVLRELSS